VKKFCVDCHGGVEMPHPEDFPKTHGATGKARPQVCAKCHGSGTAGTQFCNACHHKQGDPKKPWLPQHPAAVRAQGANACFTCHNPTYCAKCHVASASTTQQP
jgi:hypothetical protein